MIKLNWMPFRVCIAEMCRMYPTWTWRAERSGLGWSYIGETPERYVHVRLCAAPNDEDGTRPGEWWVFEKGAGQRLMFWGGK